jgi:GMP synthase (glutamine-hydrolysing)
LSSQRETVLILDFGSQYTQLIARRCREEGVFSRIESWDYALDEIVALSPVGIILSGGPNSVYDEDSPVRWDDLASLGKPVLGICYGLQVMMLKEGGMVSPGQSREYGRARVSIEAPSRLFHGLDSEQPVWMSHGDHTTKLAPGWRKLATSDSGIVAAVESEKQEFYGVQFHPEVSHTPAGDRIIHNFLYDICQARGGWSMRNYVDEATEAIAGKLGSGHAICALSGGVDSSVAAVLVHRVAGIRLQCVFVDNGLLRKNEAVEVETTFRPRFGESFNVVRAQDEFYTDLNGVSEPEVKRKLIGNRFITVFEREAKRFKDAKFLVQGTIYPDVIESASSKGPAHVIKTHHNVGGLPELLGVSLIEPLRELFKDEVRQLGRELGLPESMLMRHPFPGPGLAVRILGAVTPEAVAILQEADAIFIEELRESDWYPKVSQAFAVLLPIRSVGVMGDARTYEQVIALRSVDTRDFMTADFSPLPHDLLARVASRIANTVRGVNRVVYDVTSKPPATVEWE